MKNKWNYFAFQEIWGLQKNYFIYSMGNEDIEKKKSDILMSSSVNHDFYIAHGSSQKMVLSYWNKSYEGRR